jgi:hypothetical protein
MNQQRADGQVVPFPLYQKLEAAAYWIVRRENLSVYGGHHE